MTDPNYFEDVLRFHDRMHIDYDGPPRQLPGAVPWDYVCQALHTVMQTLREQSDGDLATFRVTFLVEELLEYCEAARRYDLAGQLDALVDLIYVACGTAVFQGFPLNAAWERVHAANLRKVPALVRSDSKRGSVYDVVKPDGWVAPDLRDLVAPERVGNLYLGARVEAERLDPNEIEREVDRFLADLETGGDS